VGLTKTTRAKEAPQQGFNINTKRHLSVFSNTQGKAFDPPSSLSIAQFGVGLVRMSLGDFRNQQQSLMQDLWILN
jgi:hypothetical protein